MNTDTQTITATRFATHTHADTGVETELEGWSAKDIHTKMADLGLTGRVLVFDAAGNRRGWAEPTGWDEAR